MASGAAFQRTGTSNCFAIPAGVASASTVVSFATPISSQPAAQATNLTQSPPCVRVVNIGTVAVYFSITSVAVAVVIPVAGTPQPVDVVQPGEDIVFTLTQFPQLSQTIALNMILNINTISASAAQTLIVSFGEGL